MKRKINIAIDGQSSCGKSTIAKAVAKELNYLYIDTGAMYRAITLFALQSKLINGDKLNEASLIKKLDNVYITFKYNTSSKTNEAYLNGTNIEKEIRSMQVSKYVSQISTIGKVREKLVRLQRRMAESKGVVMDGRDIGTVVLPEAELKIFMTAEAETRAERRYKELIAKGIAVSYNEVLDNVVNRDHIDSTREIDPLKQASDAVNIDNTHLTIEEQFQFLIGQVDKLVGTEVA